MARFKPQAQFITDQSIRDYWNGSRKNRHMTRQFNTYADLKKNLMHFLDINIDEDGVYVVRSKRGEFGEWFEYWQLVNGKPKITKQGWN